MTAAEETMWFAYHQDHPIGPDRIEAHLAQIAQLLFNVNAKKQDRRKLTDFILFYRKQVKAPEDSADSIGTFFDSWKK